jgi:hypothetical protein
LEAGNLSRFRARGKRFVGLGANTPRPERHGGAIFGARDHHPVALGAARIGSSAEAALADEASSSSPMRWDMLFRALMLATDAAQPPGNQLNTYAPLISMRHMIRRPGYFRIIAKTGQRPFATGFDLRAGKAPGKKGPGSLPGPSFSRGKSGED